MYPRRCPCAHCEEAQLLQQEEPGLELIETLTRAFAFRRNSNHSFQQTVHRGIRWLLNKVLYLTFVWSCFVLSADEGTHLERFASPLFVLCAGWLGLVVEWVDPGAHDAVDGFDESDGADVVDRMDTRYLVVWHAILSGAAVFGSKVFGHPWTGMHVYMGTLTVFIMFYPTRTSKPEIDDGSRFEAFFRMLCHVLLGMVLSALLAIFLSFVNVGFFEGGAIQEGLAIVVGNGTALLM